MPRLEIVQGILNPNVMGFKEHSGDRLVLIESDDDDSGSNIRRVRSNSGSGNGIVFKIAAAACVVATFSVALLAGLAFVYFISNSSTADGGGGGGDDAVDPIVSERAEIVSFSGRYVLTDVDAGFRRYLDSLGVHKVLHDMILNSTEVVEIIEPATAGGKWTLRRITDYYDRTYTFRLDEEFRLDVGLGEAAGVQHRCSLPESAVLVCTTRDSGRGWYLRSDLRLVSPDRLEETRTNLEKDVSTRKTFERLTQNSSARRRTGRTLDEGNYQEEMIESWD